MDSRTGLFARYEGEKVVGREGRRGVNKGQRHQRALGVKPKKETDQKNESEGVKASGDVPILGGYQIFPRYQ